MIFGKTKIAPAGENLITLSLYYKDENVEIETLEYVLINTNKPKIGELLGVILGISLLGKIFQV